MNNQFLFVDLEALGGAEFDHRGVAGSPVRTGDREDQQPGAHHRDGRRSPNRATQPRHMIPSCRRICDRSHFDNPVAAT
ncbi:hypothetical protein ABZ215_26920 [Amycolatopsis sp. NPDC006131]|uniref:hypothetical protein n=1 Tax=Amycolatopsis sp. NPDC006131 TaxID=3156731 RepID=UPI0033B6485B